MEIEVLWKRSQSLKTKMEVEGCRKQAGKNVWVHLRYALQSDQSTGHLKT